MARGTRSPVGALEVLDVNAVRRWAVLIRSVFAVRRAEIDALNVFPVPDGDTGTNLYLSFDGAIDRMLSEESDQPLDSVADLLKDFAIPLAQACAIISGKRMMAAFTGIGIQRSSATSWLPNGAIPIIRSFSFRSSAGRRPA